jgi:long-chain fatty acid transport protein
MTDNRRPSFLLVALLLSLAAPIRPAGAGFFDTFGASASGMALGNAMAALSEGWASVYYNPAALALSEDIEFSIGVFSASPNIRTDYDQGADQDLVQFPRKQGDLDTITGPAFGLVLPVQRLTPRRLPMPWAIGAGFFLPRQALVTTRVIDQTFPFDVIFQERNATLAFHLGVSTRITSALYLGLGLVSQVVTPANVYLSETTVPGGIGPPVEQVTIGPFEMSARLGSPSLLAGLLLRPTERLRIGLVYRQKSEIESSLTWNSLDELPPGWDDTDPPLTPPPQKTLERSYVSGFAPDNVSFGAAYRISERWRVTGEVTWYRWAGYGGPLGGSLDPEFNNTVVPRIGAVYRVTRRLNVRGGFYYEPTPVTNQPTGFYPIGNDRFVPSAGVGYTFDAPWGILAKPLTVDGFFQYHILRSEHWNRAVPDNPFTLNPDLTSSGNVLNFGAELTFRF